MSGEKILVVGGGNGSIVFIAADTGQILARLYNLKENGDFLVTCPPDKAFPAGIFYSTNREFIQVVNEDKDKIITETLETGEPRYDTYFHKLNLKNLIITRLKNNGHYNLLTKKHLKNRKLLYQVQQGTSLKRLRA